jgi:hypothetical protein
VPRTSRRSNPAKARRPPDPLGPRSRRRFASAFGDRLCPACFAPVRATRRVRKVK